MIFFLNYLLLGSVSERTTPNNLDQLTPWERELLKRKRIIPTDGKRATRGTSLDVHDNINL